MKRKIKIIVADPAGNITIFVKDRFGRDQYQNVAGQLLAMEELKGEQVAFMLDAPECGRAEGKMEMCGLEFCGNASRSYGLIRAHELGIDGEGQVFIDVSGCNDILTVDVNTQTGFTKVKMPLPVSMSEFDLSKLHCYKHIQESKALLSLGTLGGGNHFIEIDKDNDKNIYVVIHSGSRHLGKEVTEHYLSLGQKYLKEKGINIPYELTYLEGDLKESYLHDVEIIQDFAFLNREIILHELVKGMKWKLLEIDECIHNYIDSTDDTLAIYNSPILRKGAISAKENEKVIIPINMRDGIILGYGLGNKDWNHSAPHGAGRIIKRSELKSHFTVSSYKSEMKGIYSSCIGSDTLDEAPFAYRKIEDIIDAIRDTVEITNILTPIYNFKAGDK